MLSRASHAITGSNCIECRISLLSCFWCDASSVPKRQVAVPFLDSKQSCFLIHTTESLGHFAVTHLMH